MKRVVKFKKNKTYYFNLTSELTKGVFGVELQDSGKRTLITLNGNEAKASIDVDKKNRYYLVFKFQSATGTFELKWN